ncbi:BadF/BadG/BcrA/BcrD ATPase family protein [Halorhabdus rudnickae]|uniref:BadF/BadG/BcrA/BcrD ATPase family protein n=1 Tax=Halorhabdus rudnickae TaxID=1775544 RepID=UPI001084310E|nr:BadF/BadG/BcrA/BcrD ATPase family protein [Halorhabdus rudnickae]
MLLIGVDSGGTKTLCVAVDEAFRLQGTGQSGPGRYTAVGVDTARQNIQTAIERALPDGSTDEHVVGGFGLSGLDSQRDRTIISEFLSDINAVEDYIIENDVVVAHESLFPDRRGITVISGTGSVAYGRTRDGDSHRVGGWGWLIGDEGSGFDVARRGLQAATRAQDDRAKTTSLVDGACEHFDLASFDDVLSYAYQDIEHPKDIASFAKEVIAAAKAGDEVAQDIVHTAGMELALAAETIQARLDIETPVPVGCLGGFGRAGPVTEAFSREIDRLLPDATLVDPIAHPVVGSVGLAASKAGLDATRSRLDTLDQAIDESRS